MKIINKLLSLLLLITLVTIHTACSHDHSEEGHQHGEEEAHDHDSDEEHEEGVIHLTKDQMNTMDITLGDFSALKINDYVNATGTLGLPPNALTSVSAKAEGFIVSSNKYIEGNYVKKGVIMAYLENPEFIQQQQAYLEVKAALKFSRQELERQQALLDAEAGVEKNLQRLQAEVDSKTATLMGLAKQLEYLGLPVDKLTPDNIAQRIPLYAPMSGYLTSIKMHNGMYVSPAMELMEIVDEAHLHLELDIFEKDIANVKVGQPISYIVPALGNSNYSGEVHVIGKEFNRENKTVRIHGHLEAERPTFIKDLFVEAKIWLNDQTVSALPEGAIIKDGASSYIYICDEQTAGEVVEFTSLMVIPGTTADGFTAVNLIDSLPPGKKIVTQGAYYVYAQSKVSELEHSH